MLDARCSISASISTSISTSTSTSTSILAATIRQRSRFACAIVGSRASRASALGARLVGAAAYSSVRAVFICQRVYRFVRVTAHSSARSIDCRCPRQLRVVARLMTPQILFVQGGGANVHDGWDRKLVDSLERELGDRVRYPRMPDERDPKLASWKPALVRELDALDDGAIVVGHSVGGTILVHVLAERPTNLRALMLVATPFIGDGGWPSDEIQPRYAFAGLPPVFLYHGTDDTTVPTAHVQLYARAIPDATVRVLAGRDHQLNDDLAEVARDIRAL
jgi:hypothetical protein